MTQLAARDVPLLRPSSRSTPPPARPADLTRPAIGAAVLAGLVFGIWGAFNQRDAGAFTWGNALFGIVLAVIGGGVVLALHRFGPLLPKEVRAGSWGAVTGIGVGFLVSLTPADWLWSSVLGLLVAAPTAAATLYRLNTRHD
ncbi:hypothetical protein [Streptomyces sp. NPDC060194]|uniref:hypothetical protein n=1 Tax=Streptomyces sp. NPDC060194 TaxID=3347069 RepID=UPI003666ABB4